VSSQGAGTGDPVMTGREDRERIRASYGSTAAEYERRWDRYLRPSIGTTVAALALRSGEKVLDVGCGTGALLREVVSKTPGAEGWGVDLSPEMLSVARRSCAEAGVGLLLGNASHLAFPDGYFNAAVSTSSLHHWARPDAVFAEIRRVLRPGGRLVVTDWCRDVRLFWPFALWLQRFDASVHHVYSVDEVTDLLDAAGFVIDSVRTFRAASVWGLMTVSARRS
jgi:ubiquinone/menaquinone biosynthesis C-methylase UbiE